MRSVDNLEAPLRTAVAISNDSPECDVTATVSAAITTRHSVTGVIAGKNIPESVTTSEESKPNAAISAGIDYTSDRVITVGAGVKPHAITGVIIGRHRGNGVR